VTGSRSTQIEIETTTATTLTREKWFQETCEGGKISRLDQQFTGSCKLSDNAFAAHHAAEETSRSFAKRVLSCAFPRDKMSRVDDVAFARLLSFAIDGT
jgi:hypothetical protein